MTLPNNLEIGRGNPAIVAIVAIVEGSASFDEAILELSHLRDLMGQDRSLTADMRSDAIEVTADIINSMNAFMAGERS